MTKKTNLQLQTSMQEETNDRLRDSLVEDLTPNKIKEFAKDVDAFYLDALERCVGFTEGTRYLMSDEVNVHFYNRFKNEFPFLHLVMYSVVESKDFQEEIGLISDSTLKTKQRMMLYLFYSLIRTRSQQLMKHWAIIEPLAHFYQGNTQPCSKSMGGAFVSTQHTGFKALDDIYKERYCEFEATLDSQQTAEVAFDNYQKVLPKKNQTAHKSAVTHTGTSYFVKAHKSIRIPKHSSVTTTSGLKFKVMSCQRFNECKWIVTGDIYYADESMVTNKELMLQEKELIAKGAIMPRPG
jgi:hypothetical protein